MTNKLDRPGFLRGSRRKDGSRPIYWSPQRAVSGAPINLENVKLDESLDEEGISELCKQLTSDLREELLQDPLGAKYDGTVKGLVRHYRLDPNSPILAVKHSTRKRDYEPSLKVIEDTVGKRAVHKLKGSDFTRWFEMWGLPEEPGLASRPRRAQGAMKMVRIIFSFGAAERFPHCGELRDILSSQKFKAPTARAVKLEYEHAKSIVETAIQQRRPSIAFTQAIQWATALRRINVIGEWLPLEADEEPSGIVRGRTRWTGPTVRNLSADLIFTLDATAKGGKGTSFDLKEDDLVLLALQHYDLPETGPLIISEATGMPYRENYYALDWREVANLGGVPNDVWSMDSRAGAISEAEEVAGLSAASKMATHTNLKTTARYVRNNPLDSNREVAKRRKDLRK